MRRAVMTEPGKIIYQDVPIPDLAAEDVLIKVQRIGICGSDVHVYHGSHPFTGYPVVQGHEVSGEVAELGSSVLGLKKGDRVTFLPQKVCGQCYACRHGDYHICHDLKVMGFQTEGAGAEFFRIAADSVVRLPDNVLMDEGALVEPLSVAVHALRRTDTVGGRHVLVLGGGPIGNLVAQTAKAVGAAEVMITDLSDYRLAIAAECGIDHTVNVTTRELRQEIDNAFGEDGPDVIFECAGVEQTIADAIRVARKGTDIVIVSVFGDRPALDLASVQDRELRIIGTLMYKKEDYSEAIELLSQGRVRLTPLVTEHISFQHYLEAYKLIDERRDKVMKVMIDVPE